MIRSVLDPDSVSYEFRIGEDSWIRIHERSLKVSEPETQRSYTQIILESFFVMTIEFFCIFGPWNGHDDPDLKKSEGKKLRISLRIRMNLWRYTADLCVKQIMELHITHHAWFPIPPFLFPLPVCVGGPTPPPVLGRLVSK